MADDNGERNKNVDHPDHYTYGKYECLDVIEDLDLDMHRGLAMKYIWRAGHKGPHKMAEDLKKAIVYLERKVKMIEKQQDRLSKEDQRSFPEKAFVSMDPDKIDTVD